MNKTSIILPLVLLLAISVRSQNTGIIPQPLKVYKVKGSFTIKSNTPIIADSANLENANYLKELLIAEHQKELKINKGGGNGIILNLDPQLTAILGDEGYKLKVDNSTISIFAGTSTGVFYGIISLQQLLDKDTLSKKANLSVSGINIEDRP